MKNVFLIISLIIIPLSQISGKTIALIQINQQAQFFTEMNRGAESAATKKGHKLVIFNANNDPAAQNNAIETYIQQGVDGLIVVAIDTNGDYACGSSGSKCWYTGCCC